MVKRISVLAGILLIQILCSGIYANPLDYLEDRSKSKQVPYISSYLPENVGNNCYITIESQARFEHQSEFDFDDTKGEDANIFLHRLRMNLDFFPKEDYGAFFQVQDSRAVNLDNLPENLYEDDVDLRQGYFRFGQCSEPLHLKIGRQDLSFDDQRLVGGFNWSNVARSFDAVRLEWKTEYVGLVPFFAKPVIIDSNEFNEWDDDDNFAGLHAEWVCPMFTYFSTNFFYRGLDGTRNLSNAEKSIESMDEYTLDSVIKLGKEPWSFGFEGAYQFGDYGPGDISAAAIHTDAAYLIKACPWNSKLKAEYNFATGDDDPMDGDRETFDNLYPTNHYYYGYIDRFSWRNMHDAMVGFSVNPHKKITVDIGHHWLWLATSEDAFYNAGGGVIRPGSDEMADNYVGQELDVLVRLNAHQRLSLLAGYSHFFAQDYLDQSGNADDADYVYLQSVLTI